VLSLKLSSALWPHRLPGRLSSLFPIPYSFRNALLLRLSAPATAACYSLPGRRSLWRTLAGESGSPVRETTCISSQVRRCRTLRAYEPYLTSAWTRSWTRLDPLSRVFCDGQHGRSIGHWTCELAFFGRARIRAHLPSYPAYPRDQCTHCSPRHSRCTNSSQLPLLSWI